MISLTDTAKIAAGGFFFAQKKRPQRGGALGPKFTDRSAGGGRDRHDSDVGSQAAACDEMTFGRKTPTNTRTAGAVELVDVHRGAVANPVSLSAVAAGDLKIAIRV